MKRKIIVKVCSLLNLKFSLCKKTLFGIDSVINCIYILYCNLWRIMDE